MHSMFTIAADWPQVPQLLSTLGAPTLLGAILLLLLPREHEQA
jgi:hypothetical protein